MSQSENVDLGGLIFDAAEDNDIQVASKVIRSGEFILLQQINGDSGEIEEDEDGNFSVVLAEIDEEVAAVVCFSNKDSAQVFIEEIADDIPAGRELPAVVLDGDTLLDGLPEDCGLLVNPGTENECYFPPGSFLLFD